MSLSLHPFDEPSRHLQRFWGASGDFWQAQWDKILDITGTGQ